MSNHAVEMILARQLAGHLAVPVFIVDPEGTLVYYNEAAAAVLGRRFDETEEMTIDDWATYFAPTGPDGAPLPSEALPLVIALLERRPACRAFWIRGLDQVSRYVEVLAFPLLGLGRRFVGAFAMFCEKPPV